MNQQTFITVDLTALAGIVHECCGCTQVEACCCARFDICITAEEMERIVGLLPEVARHCPHLLDEDGYRNVFEETDDGLFSIDTAESGLCVFAYQEKGPAVIRCALHRVAGDLGIPLKDLKPSPCILWPLALSEPGNNQLSVCSDALLFRCNRCCEEQQQEISSRLLETVECLYGASARDTISKAFVKGEPSVRI